MGIYAIVTKQDLNKLSNIAEEQRNQRAIKLKKILKQSHDKKLAKPTTKKLEEISDNTQ